MTTAVIAAPWARRQVAHWVASLTDAADGAPASGDGSSARSKRATGHLRPTTPESLFGLEYRGLVRTLTVIASGDVEAAHDAAQDAFVQACVHWRRIERYDDPMAWIRRVAINRVKNHHRKNARRKAAIERLGEPDRVPAPSSAVDLERALRALPEKQRVAAVLHYVNDLSIKQVAASMGLSEGTINRHLHRARQALRPHLEVSS